MLDGPEIVRLILRRWWLIVLLAVLGGIGGYAFSKSHSAHYSASEDLLVTAQAPNPLLVNLTNNSQDPARVVQTQVDVLESPAVSQLASSTLGGATPNVSVTSSTASNLVTLTANAATETAASRSLRAVVDAYNTVSLQVPRGQINGARSVLVQKLAQARSAKKASNSHPNNNSLTTQSQQIPQLQTLLDQLDASLKLGVTASQPIGGIHPSGPTVSPRKAQAIGIGVAGGIGVAVMIAVGLGRGAVEERRFAATPHGSGT
jgi:uncharacterized protein involved in exopolysaccharide biosynthesis